jgi:fumarate hydratase class II
MSARGKFLMASVRVESDSMGKDKLWGSQTQRSLEHFSIGHELIVTAGRRLLRMYRTENGGWN